MIKKASRKKGSWPHEERVGRVVVRIYKRRTPSGTDGFMVADYSQGKRRLVSYPSESEALEAANLLAQRMNEGKVLVAGMANEDAAAYASATQNLRPFRVGIVDASAVIAHCLKIVNDLEAIKTACAEYALRVKQITRRPVADVVDDLIVSIEAKKKSVRYVQDLRARLGKFAQAFKVDICDVKTADVQLWLDGLRVAPQTSKNYATVLHRLFGFALARGYVDANPISGIEAQDVVRGAVTIYSPAELRQLLNAAPPEYQPCLALAAFAGLRAAEIQRLTWEEIHFADRQIFISEDISKTATARVIPMGDALLAWIQPRARLTGLVWGGTEREFHYAQEETSAKSKVAWKPNALRHSFASYRLALTKNVARVADEMGNSSGVIHKHYKKILSPSVAEEYFAILPAAPKPSA